MHAQSLQVCWSLSDPMDCSPRGSSVRGILQAGTLEWAALPSSGGLPHPGLNLQLRRFLHSGEFFIAEALGKPLRAYAHNKEK